MQSTFGPFYKMLVALLIPNIGSVIGAIIAFTNREWFNGLIRPKFTPPNWTFFPALIISHCCMGVASYLVFDDPQTTGTYAWIAISVYFIQIIMKFIWILIFFHFHSVERVSLDLLMNVWRSIPSNNISKSEITIH